MRDPYAQSYPQKLGRPLGRNNILDSVVTGPVDKWPFGGLLLARFFGLLEAVFRRAEDLRRGLFEALKGGFRHDTNSIRFAGCLQ